MSLALTFIISISFIVGIPLILTILSAFNRQKSRNEYLLKTNQELDEQNRSLLNSDDNYISQISDINNKLEGYEREIREIEKRKAKEQGGGPESS